MRCRMVMRGAEFLATVLNEYALAGQLVERT